MNYIIVQASNVLTNGTTEHMININHISYFYDTINGTCIILSNGNRILTSKHIGCDLKTHLHKLGSTIEKME